MQKLKLVYILGMAHSGSTLLDLLLGGHKSVVSTGEIWAFSQWVRDNKNCSCNLKVKDCNFWNGIIDTLHDRYNLSSARLHKPEEIEKSSKLSRLWSVARVKPFFDKESAVLYGEKEYKLFKVILENSGAEIAVDSSKLLERLIKLHYSDFFEIKIIHLVRDGRSTLDSIRRAIKRGTTPNRYVNPIWVYLGWMLEMERQCQYLQGLDHQLYKRISYLKLASNPRESLETLCNFIGILFNPKVLDISSSNYVFKQEHHLIGGNRIKSSLPTASIRPKVKWNRNLSRFEKFLFKMLGGERMNKRIGVK